MRTIPVELDILEHEAPELREMIRSEGWRIFKRLVDLETSKMMEKLVNAKSEEVPRLQGRIKALADITELAEIPLNMMAINKKGVGYA